MNNRIKKAITVNVPGNICNLRCSYCYISCSASGELNEKPHFKYPVDHMIEAFAPERLGGGVCGHSDRLSRNIDTGRND